MALQVEQLPLGPIGTNCYVVRAGASAAEAVVVDPSGDADRAPAAARAPRRALRRDPRHARALGPPRRRRRPRRGHGRARAHGRGRAHAPREPGAASRRRASPLRAVHAATSSSRRRDARGRRHRVRGARGAGALAGPPRLPRRRRLFSGDVLFAGSVGRTDLPGARLGHARRLDPHARRDAIRPRPSSTRATARRRRWATSSRGTRSSPSSARSEPGERDGRRSSGRAERTTSSRPSSRSGAASSARPSGCARCTATGRS